MKKILFIAAILLQQAQAQQQSVSGTVLSAATQQPLTGATVQVKGERQIVLTNGSGEFSIAAPAEAVLIISHTGYSTSEVKPGTNRTGITVVLKEAGVILQEVNISNGYQQIPKERSTGSFTVISNKLFNQQVGTNVLDRLEAVTGSLLVDRKSSGGGMMIRGLSTINGVRAPLIILDNFPYAGDINTINPNDVENITVLKDAAAASIWGAKAGNGVIVITTKKGRFNQKISVDVAANITIGEVPDLFYQKQISTGEFISVEQFLFSKGFRFSDTALSTKPVFSPVYEILFKQRRGQLSAAEAAAQIDALRNIDVRNDFLKYFYQRSFNTQYAVNIRGGSASMAWILSAGVDRNISNTGAAYNRFTSRFQNIYKVSSKLELSAGISIAESNTGNGKPGYGAISSRSGAIYPYAQFADAAGNPVALPKDLRRSYIDTAGAGKLLNWNYYPLEDYKHVNNKTILRDLIAKAGLNYKILNSLQLDIKYQYGIQPSETRNLQDADSYFARDLINRFSQLNRSTGIVTYKIPVGGILDLSQSSVLSQNLRAQLNFNGTWKQHSVNAIAGAEISSLNTGGNSYRTYGYNDDILTGSNVDVANTYPSFVNGSNSFIPNPVNFSEKINRFVSAYFNGAYNYRSCYTVTVSARRDASNIFGQSTNDRWNPLWSAGAAWEISKESFYKFSLFPLLKLRITAGYSGNTDPSMSAVTTIAYQNTNPFTLSPYAGIVNFYNPDLRWEKVRTLNAAIDFRSKNNTISGSIEAYQKNCTDLFGSAPIDYTTGLGRLVVTKNVASMVGRGMDIELNTINTNGKLKWSTALLISFYKDKVQSFFAAGKTGNNYISNGELLTAMEGKPVYGVYSYKWAGLDPLTGDPQGYINGQVSKDYTALINFTLPEELVYHGPQNPPVFGSVGNTINWKKLSVTARVVYRFGHWYRKRSISYGDLYNAWSGHADYTLRWQKSGDEAFTNVPSMIYPAVNNRDAFYNGSEVLAARADNVRLQYINVSYNIHPPVKNIMKSITVFMVVNNVAMLWKADKHGADPDYRNAVIPPSRSVSFGLNISF